MNKTATKILVSICILSIAIYYFISTTFQPTSWQSDFPLTKAWSRKLDGQVVEISTAGNGYILARTIYSLYAIETTTGKEIWKFPLNWEVETAPAIANYNKVYIADSKSLYALEQTNGKVVWKQSLAAADPWVVDVKQKVVLIHQPGGEIRAYDAEKGNFLWKVGVGRGTIKAYIIGDLVYIPDDGIEAVDIKTGQISQKTGSGSIGQNAAFNGIIYYSNGNMLTAFDTQKQVKLWENHLPIYFSRGFALKDGIFITTDQGHVFAYNKDSGESIWQVSISDPVNPTIMDNTLFVMEGFTRRIIAIDLQSAKITGMLKTSVPQFLRVDQSDMIATRDLLLFTKGSELFAYNK